MSAFPVRLLHPVFALLMAVATAAGPTAGARAQSNPILGQIQYFAYDFCPQGWTLADGRSIDLNDEKNQIYTALFAYIGQSYGGSGNLVFNLPDAQGRMLVHADAINNSGPLPVGSRFGAVPTPVGQDNVPVHRHNMIGTSASRDQANLDNATFADFPPAYRAYSSSATQRETLSSATLAPSGQTEVETAQPFLALRACIAIEGRWPPHPSAVTPPPNIAAEAAPDTQNGADERADNWLTRLGRWFSDKDELPSDPDPIYWDGLVTGDLLAMSGHWCPDGLVQPAGQWLSLGNSDNQLLYAAIGNQYGYQQPEYRLPDLRQRVPIHPDYSNEIDQADAFGTRVAQLGPRNLPSHDHVMRASSQRVNDGDGTGAQLGAFLPGARFYSSTPLNEDNSLLMHDGMITPTFQGRPFEPLPFSIEFPSLAVNYCIVYYSEPAQRP